jgi:hypothetical protein
LDDFDHCVINRTIHGLYSWKIAPTVSIIHKKIKDSIKISKSKLTLTLIDLVGQKEFDISNIGEEEPRGARNMIFQKINHLPIL